VSGLWSWVQDQDHIEKAFDFSGMGARNGVTAAVFVQAGLTGVHDVLGGTHNLLQALSTQPKPEEMVAGLGSRYIISETCIKTFTVGFPNQSPLDALLKLRREHGLSPDQVDRIVVHLPEDAIGRAGANARRQCPYLIATALVDGGVSPTATARAQADPRIRSVMERVTVIGDPAQQPPRHAAASSTRCSRTAGR
jgi:2-methylcitrate dehydratase PrpD